MNPVTVLNSVFLWGSETSDYTIHIQSNTATTEPMSLQGMRKEDTPKTRIWSRTDRLFEEAGSWYFYTREGTVEGPFASKVKALDRLDVYINLAKAGLSPDAGQAPAFELSPL